MLLAWLSTYQSFAFLLLLTCFFSFKQLLSIYYIPDTAPSICN
jgi:hypothetical protein